MARRGLCTRAKSSDSSQTLRDGCGSIPDKCGQIVAMPRPRRSDRGREGLDTIARHDLGDHTARRLHVAHREGLAFSSSAPLRHVERDRWETPYGRSRHQYPLVSVIELLLRDAAGTWWAFGLIAAGIVASAASSIMQLAAG